MTIKAPFLPYNDLLGKAEQFLAEYHPSGTLPIPIERIVEFKFGIDIIAIPGLRDLIEVDAFPSNRLKEFYVDEFVYKKRPNRYHFSLAHEIAHVVLHQDVFAKLKFNSIQEWLDAQDLIPDDQYSWIEWQAYTFAGLVLVPPTQLRSEFDSMMDDANLAGLSRADICGEEDARKTFETHLARPFAVSQSVIAKRAKKDMLWD